MAAEAAVVPGVIEPDLPARLASARARVLVEIRAGAGSGTVSTEDAIARAQAVLLARVPAEHVSLVRRYTSIPMLALDVDAAGLRALESMGDLVVSVKLDGTSRPQ